LTLKRDFVCNAAFFVCAAAIFVCSAASAAEPIDLVPDGAPLYASLRPVALSGVLRRLGVDQLPSVQELRRSMGGLDPLEPSLLAPAGLDVAAPIVASLFEAAGPRQVHHRGVALLRDSVQFRTFLDAIASGGGDSGAIQKVDPKSPAGLLGVLATAKVPDGSTVLIARVREKLLVVDAVGAWQGAPATPAEIAKRFPLDGKTRFAATRGARRLFTPDAALVLYGDGRKLNAQLAEWSHELDAKTIAKCKAEWSKAPTTFDDLGAALIADGAGVRLVLGWGTQGGAPLGGLRFAPVDDNGLDLELLKRQSPAVLALYAASLTPFTNLKRSGVFSSLRALGDSAGRCNAIAVGPLIVRSWPLALGALVDGAGGSSKSGNPILASLVATFGRLRNVIFAVKEVAQSTIHFAVGATLDPSARSLIEVLLAGAAGGGAGQVTPIGKRSPTVYGVTLGDLGQAVAALETLPSGSLAFTVADADDTFQWAYRQLTPAGPPPPRANPPVASLHLDAAALAKLTPLFNLGSPAQPGVELFAHLRRLDADLTTDGDLLRLTVRAPLEK
jgi:hypothetical protein